MTEKISIWDSVAVLTAMQKIVKERLDELRGECDDNMLSQYESEGVTKRALKVNDQKVGDYTVTFSKEGFAASDMDALGEFAMAYGFAREKRIIKPECMSYWLDVIEGERPEDIDREIVLDKDWANYMTKTGGVVTYLDSGEVVPGVVVTPAEANGTRVTGCKPNEVVPIVREMGGIDQLLLGGAE